MEKYINPYITTWVEFFPDYGIVTKHDKKLFGDVFLRGRDKTYRKHFPSKEIALAWLEAFDASKLDKPYTCYLFTDKQFAMAKAKDGYAIPYTKKQRENPIRLGGPYDNNGDLR